MNRIDDGPEHASPLRSWIPIAVPATLIGSVECVSTTTLLLRRARELFWPYGLLAIVVAATAAWRAAARGRADSFPYIVMMAVVGGALWSIWFFSAQRAAIRELETPGRRFLFKAGLDRDSYSALMGTGPSHGTVDLAGFMFVFVSGDEGIVVCTGQRVPTAAPTPLSVHAARWRLQCTAAGRVVTPALESDGREFRFLMARGRLSPPR